MSRTRRKPVKKAKQEKVKSPKSKKMLVVFYEKQALKEAREEVS